MNIIHKKHDIQMSYITRAKQESFGIVWMRENVGKSIATLLNKKESKSIASHIINHNSIGLQLTNTFC